MLYQLTGYLQEHSAPPLSSHTKKTDYLVKAVSIDNRSTISIARASKAQQRNNSPVIIVEKLPSFIQVATQLVDVNLSHLPNSALNTLNSNPSLIMELPLQANIEKLMDKIPLVWKKVS